MAGHGAKKLQYLDLTGTILTAKMAVIIMCSFLFAEIPIARNFGNATKLCELNKLEIFQK